MIKERITKSYSSHDKSITTGNILIPQFAQENQTNNGRVFE